MEELNQYIKEAFEHKNRGSLKEAINYFYKALTVDNDSVEIMKELSLLYSQLNQNERAISFCEQILTKRPEDYEIRFFMCKLYEKLSDYEKAQENLMILIDNNENVVEATEELFLVLKKLNNPKKIIEIYKSNEAVLNSSIIYYFVAWANSELNNNTEAEYYYKRSFEIDPYNTESGSKVANLLFNKGEYAETEKILIKLLEYSENDKIYYLLGELSYLKNVFDDAIKYYILAIKLNENNSEYYYKLGSAYMEKGFFIQAEENYSKAIILDPDNILYNYTLAYLYIVDKKYSLARKTVDFILTLDSFNIQALSLKLNILLQCDDFSEVGTLAEKIIKSEEKTEQAYYVLALYYSKMQVWNNAIENIKNAIKYNETSCEYKQELSSYYFEINDIEDAKVLCEEILKINNKYIDAYILLSKIYFRLNDYEKVHENINKAMSLDMNIPEIYYIKGQLFEKTGNKEKAIENYKTALSMSPKNIVYYKSTAHCYYDMNDYKSAYDYYKEASTIEMIDGECHYFMAKCADNNGEKELAISNYSMARRLSPLNVQYLEDYAKALSLQNKKKQAISIVKNSMKLFSDEDKQKLKKLINKL